MGGLTFIWLVGLFICIWVTFQKVAIVFLYLLQLLYGFFNPAKKAMKIFTHA